MTKAPGREHGGLGFPAGLDAGGWSVSGAVCARDADVTVTVAEGAVPEAHVLTGARHLASIALWAYCIEMLPVAA